MGRRRREDEGSERKEQLAFFVEFINTDLTKISRTRRERLAFEVHHVSHGGVWGSLDYPAPDNEPSEGSRGALFLEKWKAYYVQNTNLEQYQERLKDFLGQITRNANAVQGISQDVSGRPSEEVSQLMFGVQLVTVKMAMTFSLQVRLFPEEKILINGQSVGSLVGPFNLESAEQSPVRFGFRAPSHDDTLVYAFMRCLEGVPLASFRTCPECGNHFIHVSQRQRTYCSNNCASRAKVRETRRLERLQAKSDEKVSLERDKDLQEKAKKARKSYEAKQKKLNPRAKVARRPYKHKEED